MKGSVFALNNLYTRAVVSLGVRKMDLQTRAIDARIRHIQNTALALQTKLEEARAIEDTPKSVKDKIAADLRNAEKHLMAVKREVQKFCNLCTLKLKVVSATESPCRKRIHCSTSEATRLLRSPRTAATRQRTQKTWYQATIYCQHALWITSGTDKMDGC
jgi:hypothetical protein